MIQYLTRVLCGIRVAETSSDLEQEGESVIGDRPRLLPGLVFQGRGAYLEMVSKMALIGISCPDSRFLSDGVE